MSNLERQKSGKIIPREHSENSRPWFDQQGQRNDANQPSGFVKTVFGGSGNSAASEQQDAIDAGFQKGYADGLARAESELTLMQQQLKTTLTLLHNPLEKIDAQVEHELLELSLEIARQILRREIKANPRHLIGLIRDAVKQLPSSIKDINLHLHPEEAETVRTTLEKHQSDEQWHVVSDPTVANGDCHLRADSSFVHVGIDALIGQLAAEYLGDNRSENATEVKKK